MTTASGATRHTFATSDATTLSYLDAGTGPALVLIPGWSQTAASFDKQIAFFARQYRVVAVDHRGQGDSGKTSVDYSVPRMADDLHQLLTHLALTDVAMLGHSMGCAVIWSYWQQFGGHRISRLVLVDQPPAMVHTSAWSDEERQLLGAPLATEDTQQIVAGLTSPAAVDIAAGSLRRMFSSHISDQDAAWFLEQNLKTPRLVAAQVFADEAFADWRTIIPTIDVPTLVTAGEVSIYPPTGPTWVAEHIPGSRLRIFTAGEKGSHFVFWENDVLFNSVVLKFLDQT